MSVTRRRSRSCVGGGGPRSACPALKSEVTCKENTECKWNVNLSKCRKARATTKKNVKTAYQAKFIEIRDEKIMKGLNTAKYNMNPNYEDKKYFAQLKKYKPSKKTGINVGDILCIMGGEYQYCIYIALSGKVEWLGDDGDTIDFVTNLLLDGDILKKKNVKYAKLFKNEDYYVLAGVSSGLQHVQQKNEIVSTHLLGEHVVSELPQEILNTLSDGGLIN
jgi:asparagine N-glycosylation enzyme membrane subunit Stt3